MCLTASASQRTWSGTILSGGVGIKSIQSNGCNYSMQRASSEVTSQLWYKFGQNLSFWQMWLKDITCQTLWFRALLCIYNHCLILNMLHPHIQSIFNYIYICLRTAWAFTARSHFAPLFILDARERSTDSWLRMQAAAWLKLRCIWIKQTGTASINLCVEIKASHTWKAGSPWFPLELGLVAMGLEGAFGGELAQSDRKTVSSFHLRCLFIYVAMSINNAVTDFLEKCL